MKSLKFKSNLAEQILNGNKTVTWRLFDDKNLQIDDELDFINFETGEHFAMAVVTETKEKKLGEIIDADYEYSHYEKETQTEMLKHYKEIYGDKVDLDTIMKMIKFRLLSPND